MLEVDAEDLTGIWCSLQRRAGLKVEPGALGIQTLGGHRVDIALAQDDVIIAADLNLVAILGAEQHSVTDLHRPDVGAQADHLRPGEALAHLRGSRNEDASGRSTLTVGPIDLDEYAIGQHLDGKSIVDGHGRKRYRVVVMSDDLNARAISITSNDGTHLEAVVDRTPASVDAIAVAAVAHPHPQYGGDMHNNVVAAMARGLTQSGVETIRFNFRGVGESGGRHSGGASERDDYFAALDAANAIDETARLYACGYSFGADVALTCGHDRLACWIVVAPPLRVFTDDLFVAAIDARPKHIIAGEHDPFASPSLVRAATAGWRNVQLHTVDMADHFFAGATASITRLVTEIVMDER